LSKTQMIEELTKKLSALKEQRDKLDAEAYEWAEKRNELNDKVKSLRDGILELRAERDRINDQVKELKQQRNDTTTRIREEIEEMKKLNQESKALAKKRPSRSHQALQKEVESIDWKIQTTPLTLQEDKELVGQVKELEAQLNVYRKLEQLAQKVLELRKEVRALRSENGLRHQKLTKNAEESQEIHRNMIGKIEDSKKYKIEADVMHKRFLEVKEKARPVEGEMMGLANQIRQLRAEIRVEEEKERKQDQDALRETLERQAREKLKRGEKLTWEEFQLLAEKGVTAED
jgi:uncharacterized coiled-coil DUF342 family protein